MHIIPVVEMKQGLFCSFLGCYKFAFLVHVKINKYFGIMGFVVLVVVCVELILFYQSNVSSLLANK